MKLRKYQLYPTADGFLILESDFKKMKGECFAIVKLLTGTNPVVMTHKTMTKKELRQVLNIEDKEVRIENNVRINCKNRNSRK